MNRLSQAALAVLAWALPCLCAFGQPVASRLTSADLAELEKGATLYVPEEVAGKAWPRGRVYKYVLAEPAEIVAVFFDYANASKFVPNVEVSKIVKTLHSWQQDVYYEIDLPLLPNEQYTARNTLSHREDGTQIEVAWKVEKGRFFSTSAGNLRVEKWKDGSIVCYENLVDPGSQVAILLRSRARDQLLDVVKALAARVESMRKKNPGELAAKAKALNAVLDAKAAANQ